MYSMLKAATEKTKLLICSIVTLLLFSTHSTAQIKTIDVEAFNKIIISSHIEVIFKQGEKESVSIESIKIPIEKLEVIVKNNTLQVYLEGAKITTGKKKEYKDGEKRRTSIYKGTIAKVIIIYKKINALDLRGEEKFVFESLLNSEKLDLKIYGESQVYMNLVAIQNLSASIYGESSLEIKQGEIEKQKFTTYGESSINVLNIENKETKLTTYGEGKFLFNVSEKLKVTSYGESTIKYTGNAILSKGIVIGETKITKINL